MRESNPRPSAYLNQHKTEILTTELIVHLIIYIINLSLSQFYFLYIFKK